MKKTIVVCVIIITLLGGCTRKKNESGDAGRFEGTFAYEKRVLLDMIDILNRFNSLVLQASTSEEITKATEDFCVKLEILDSEITFVTEKHPTWVENPPEEIKSIIQEYIDANRTFGTLSFDIVKNKVENHPEDEELALAFERLRYITAPDDQDEKSTVEETPVENEEKLLW